MGSSDLMVWLTANCAICKCRDNIQIRLRILSSRSSCSLAGFFAMMEQQLGLIRMKVKKIEYVGCYENGNHDTINRFTWPVRPAEQAPVIARQLSDIILRESEHVSEETRGAIGFNWKNIIASLWCSSLGERGAWILPSKYKYNRPAERILSDATPVDRKDIYSLDADGSVFDAALLSAVAAFSSCKPPFVISRKLEQLQRKKHIYCITGLKSWGFRAILGIPRSLTRSCFRHEGFEESITHYRVVLDLQRIERRSFTKF
ncbi:hypothetical protein C5167_028351 [Papaver somniferum]|nr:hypothetical protein C5167_028351 [Papaver somniferum]